VLVIGGELAEESAGYGTMVSELIQNSLLGVRLMAWNEFWARMGGMAYM
jgi:hypothetical protein